MNTITITAADIDTARTLSGKRKPRLAAYADRWDAAARAAGSRSVHAECDALTPAIRAIANSLFCRESWCVSIIGYDEIASLWTNGRNARVRSSLPRSADPLSHAVSLAIELVATLDAGEHTIAVGSTVGTRRLEFIA
jgi:hypothetical protein